MRALRWLLVTALGVAALAALPSASHSAPEAHAAPNFKAPFPCNQTWTYSHHSAEVRMALDFIASDGSPTDGAPVLASAAGTATTHYESGAGNYVVIDHGDGWTTYYFHLGSFSISDGQYVEQGQQVGTTGSTGNSSGPHQHYEQLYYGEGQHIYINGQALGYPSEYYQEYLTSDNCGDGGGDYNFSTWGEGVNVREDAYLDSPVVTTLPGPTQVYVECQKQGDTVHAEGYTNNWWSKLRDQGGFISNIYIAHPDAKLPGVPECGSGGGETNFTTWGEDVNVRSDAYLSSSVVTTLSGPTDVYVECQKQGDTVNAEGYTNDWWSKLRDQGGYISNIYIDVPDYKLPGVPEC